VQGLVLTAVQSSLHFDINALRMCHKRFVMHLGRVDSLRYGRPGQLWELPIASPDSPVSPVLAYQYGDLAAVTALAKIDLGTTTSFLT